ncbi:hypothetical protein AB0J83_21385 [Actinoplanes sp. NPDC049596]|uniref:hypothetical protein n=1 Tax=unclassified Actinoplanes TaxID=2626549 RepID=UPI00344A0091
MSIDKTGSGTDELLAPEDEATTPETPRPRLRHAVTTRAAQLRETAPAKVRQAGGAVRRKPVPAAGALAAVGAVIAVVLVRRRAAQAKAARSRWVPARFQR